LPQVKAEQLREQGVGELTQRLAERRRELLQLRAQQAMGQLDNPHRLRLVRREIARIMTVLREKAKENEGAKRA